MGHTNEMETIRYALKNKPIITSLVDDNDLGQLLETSSNLAFILSGDISSTRLNLF